MAEPTKITQAEIPAQPPRPKLLHFRCIHAAVWVNKSAITAGRVGQDKPVTEGEPVFKLRFLINT